MKRIICGLMLVAGLAGAGQQAWFDGAFAAWQGAGQELWTPEDLGGLFIWLDGKDQTTMFADAEGTTTVSLDGEIRRWNSKTGNGQFFAARSGEPGFDWKGTHARGYRATGTRLMHMGAAGTSTGDSALSFMHNGELSVFVAWRPVESGAAANARHVFFDNNAAGTGAGYHFAMDNRSSLSRTRMLNTFTSGTGTVAAYQQDQFFDVNQSQLTAVVIDNTAASAGRVQYVSRNGEAQSVGNTATGTPSSSAPFRHAGLMNSHGGAITLSDRQANAVDGRLYGFIVTSNAVSQADANRVEGWMAHHYGWTDRLPAYHPYKTNPPYKTVIDYWQNEGLNEGLVSYWAMRTSGTTVFDEWGTNTLSAVGSPVFSSANGVRDGGVGTSSGNYVQVIKNASLNTTSSAFTIAAWIKPTTLTAHSCVISNGGYQHSGWLFRVLSSGALNLGTYTSGSHVNTASPASAIATGAWYHVAATRSGAAVRLFVNGIDVTSSAGNHTTITESAFPVSIGANRTTGTFDPFNGSIDEVAIWTRALSSNEVYQIYSTPLYAPYRED